MSPPRLKPSFAETANEVTIADAPSEAIPVDAPTEVIPEAGTESSQPSQP